MFTENVLVTIGMFCDDWFQHKFAQILHKHAQFCTSMHNFAQACTPHGPRAQVVQIIISQVRSWCRTVAAMMLALARILQENKFNFQVFSKEFPTAKLKI